MAEELFKVRKLVTVGPGKAYPTGDEVTQALCSACFRLYHESGFPIASQGLVTADYVHKLGPQAIPLMHKLLLHSSNAGNTRESIRIPCELCGRAATDQGEFSGAAKAEDVRATGLPGPPASQA